MVFHSDTIRSLGAVFHSDTRSPGAVFHSDTSSPGAVFHSDTKSPGTVFHPDSRVPCAFLDALASLKTMLDIDSVMFSRFQD